MSFLELRIDATDNPELEKQLEADGGAFLKVFAEKAQQLVNQMCKDTRAEAYEKACKEDPAMVALLRGDHDPNGQALLGRATDEAMLKLFSTGYDAGYQAGKKRKRVETLVVDELNKQLKGHKEPEPEEEPMEVKATVYSEAAAAAMCKRAKKEKGDAKKEEEEGEEEGVWQVVMPDKKEEEKKDEPKYKSAVATPEDANPPYRSTVAHVDDNGDEEPKYQSLSA